MKKLSKEQLIETRGGVEVKPGGSLPDKKCRIEDMPTIGNPEDWHCSNGKWYYQPR